MIDLGTGPALPTLGRITLAVDEMDLLLDRLDLDELPVVLAQVPRFDSSAERDAAFGVAAESLAQRGLLDGDVVHDVLADRLRLLNRPHWAISLRLFRDETISRLCIAGNGDLSVLALRGPDSYVLEDVTSDVGSVVVAALGDAEPLVFAGFSAPTVELGAIFDDADADTATTTQRIAEIAVPARESNIIAAAMADCRAHTEIVAVYYGDGTRNQAQAHVAVFDTRAGRFVATSSVAADGTTWSALSSGSGPRIRHAVDELVASLPERAEFAPTFSP